MSLTQMDYDLGHKFRDDLAALVDRSFAIARAGEISGEAHIGTMLAQLAYITDVLREHSGMSHKEWLRLFSDLHEARLKGEGRK